MDTWEKERQEQLDTQQALNWYNNNKEVVRKELKKHGYSGSLMQTNHIVRIWKEKTQTRSPEIKPLTDKINWKKNPELLKTHLEKLYDNKFIDYTDIDKVISGEEFPRTIKNNKFSSEKRNILYIFFIWYEKQLIDDSFVKKVKDNDNKLKQELQYEYFIIPSFSDKNGDVLKQGSLSRSSQEDKGGFTRTDNSITPKDKTLYKELTEILTA